MKPNPWPRALAEDLVEVVVAEEEMETEEDEADSKRHHVVHSIKQRSMHITQTALFFFRKRKTH